MPSRRAQAGFTLVELMIVVLIIGVGAALSASGIANAFSEDRARRATRELVRMGRRARSDTVRYRIAHMMWIQAGGGLNQVSLLRATGPSCTNETWATALAVETLNLLDPNGTYAQDGFPARIEAAANNTAICYSPTGLMMSANPATLAAAAAALTLQSGTGGFVFDIVRRDVPNNVNVGVARQVIFPQGAPARVMR